MPPLFIFYIVTQNSETLKCMGTMRKFFSNINLKMAIIYSIVLKLGVNL